MSIYVWTREIELDDTKVARVVLHFHKVGHRRSEPVGIRETKYDGFARVKEFYHPRYDRALLPDETDFRRTLYWNPDVKTNQDGKASISFYNNGSCKAMNVSAETVTTNGAVGVINK
jgi:hypothetical protein